VTVRKERSNQLNYVPSLFSYLYRKPVCLVAFLRFNRFASVACFNPVEPNSEVNGHHGDQAKPSSKHCPTDDTNPEQLSLPREGIVAEHRLIRQALTRMRVKVLGGRSSIVGFTTFTDDEMNAKLKASTGDASPAPMRFFSYKDREENTREQIKKVRSHPWIAKEVPVRGSIFDVDTGRLSEVRALE
jgi:hypothetical protein